MYKVLILGGTSEGVALANKLSADPIIIPITSLAGRTREPKDVQGFLRQGGFGGVEGLVHYLKSEEVFAVFDATHPFAIQITKNAFSACKSAKIPLARLTREPWAAETGDDWHNVENIAEAVESIPVGARAFVTTGRQELEPYFERRDIWTLVRVIDMPAKQLELGRGKFIAGRGPFSVEDEVDLMRGYGVDLLVSKNSGGQSSYGKIIAARQLGLPVVMVRPPELKLETIICYSLNEASKWLEGCLN